MLKETEREKMNAAAACRPSARRPGAPESAANACFPKGTNGHRAAIA